MSKIINNTFNTRHSEGYTYVVRTQARVKKLSKYFENLENINEKQIQWKKRFN